MADDAEQAGRRRQGRRVHDGRRSVRQPADPLENDVEDLKTLSLQSTQAADQAKAAVEQNAAQLQQKLAERQKLLSQLDQAKMQEQMNTAMASLSETVGQDVPTFDEVRDKIEARYAKAKGMAELPRRRSSPACSRSRQAAVNTEAQARLAEIRAELGIAPPPTPEELAAPTATPSVEAPKESERYL